MIEDSVNVPNVDEKVQFKVAESPEEAAWENVRRSTERRILEGNIQKEIDDIIVKHAKEKLESFSKK